MTLPRGTGNGLRLAALGIVVSAIVPLACMALAWFWEHQAERDWARAGEPLDVLLARYPKVRANEAAQRLEQLMAPFGIRLDAGAAPAPGRAPLLQRVGTYVSRQTVFGDETIEPVPDDVAALLTQGSELIVALEGQLLEGEAPIWSRERPLIQTATPPLYGHRLVNELLLAHALMALHAGDDTSAERALVASWTLRRSLETDPRITPQLAAALVSEFQNSILRRLPHPSPQWRDRVALHPDWSSMARADEIDAYEFAFWLQANVAGSRPVPVLWLARGGAFGRILGRLSAADYSRRLARAVLAQRAESACRVTADDLRLGPWNVPGENWRGMRPRHWVSVARAALDAELTTHVLDARSAASGSPLPSASASDACPGLHWLEERGDDGSITIKLDREPFADVPHPPTSFRLGPPRHIG